MKIYTNCNFLMKIFSTSLNTNFDAYLLQEFRIISAAFFIWSLVIINGGEMRRQCGANKNQSVNTPVSIEASITFLFVSKESNSRANHNPKERMHFILG